MQRQLFSDTFGDIYFSPDDGLAETRHVFIAGNDLPARWQGRSRFIICETGFGSGLNFLATWSLFEETAPDNTILDYISIERYPLTAETVQAALAQWSEAFGGRLEILRKLWPLRIPGFHRIQVAPRVRLTLVFDDVNDALPQITAPGGVDAWFLDGFAPARNPDMWSDTLYREMARLSGQGATVATFTAAGHVRRGLQDAGFTVTKQRGFGRKRDMSIGRFEQGGCPPCPARPSRVAVIGGGLAGTAAAQAIHRRGMDAVIFGPLAQGASGNEIGLYNPRFSAMRDPQSDFYASAFARIAHGRSGSGNLHLVTDADKHKRFQAMLDHWHWPDDHMRYLPADEASALAGVKIDHEALYLPDGGALCPAALCRSYARDMPQAGMADLNHMQPDGSGWRVNGDRYDAVILACGVHVRECAALSWLPVHTVRGQMSMAAATPESRNLRVNISFGGYISAPLNGIHAVGATFQKWLDNPGLRDEDNRDNISRLAACLPHLADGLTVTGARAALRTSSRDRFPIAGEVPGVQNLYVSTAHGSHGIVTSAAAAELLADIIDGSPCSLSADTMAGLAPQRFLDRMRRKGQLPPF